MRDLSDIIIAVDQISQLKNTVARIIQMSDDDKNDDNAEISLSFFALGIYPILNIHSPLNASAYTCLWQYGQVRQESLRNPPPARIKSTPRILCPQNFDKQRILYYFIH